MAKTTFIYLVLLAFFTTSFADRKRLNNVESQMTELQEYIKSINKLLDAAPEDDQETNLFQALANKYYYYIQGVFYNCNKAIQYALDAETKKNLKILTEGGEKVTFDIGKHVNGNAKQIKKAIKSAFEFYQKLTLMPKPIDQSLQEGEQHQASRNYVRMAYDTALFTYAMVHREIKHRKDSSQVISKEIELGVTQIVKLLETHASDNPKVLEEYKVFIHAVSYFTDRLAHNIDNWLYVHKEKTPIAQAVSNVPLKLRKSVKDLRDRVLSNSTVTEFDSSLTTFYSHMLVEVNQLSEVEKYDSPHWNDIRREIFLEILFILDTSKILLELLSLQ